MLYTAPSALSIAGCVLVAVSSVTFATAAAWLDCSSRPESLTTFGNSIQSDEAWPLNSVVLVEGFVRAVNAERHEFSIASKDGGAEVVVAAPADVDVTAFGSDLVRVHGLASTLRGTPAVLLQKGDVTVGGVVACPPMHATSRKLSQTEVVPCGEFLPGKDLAGGDIAGSGLLTTGNQDCLQSCLDTPSCNAMARISDGRCFLKNVPEDHPAIDAPEITSYRVCPENGGPANPPDDGKCGGGGQPVCSGAQLADRDPKWQCDQGFVGGAGDICVPWVAPGSDPTPASPPEATPPEATPPAATPPEVTPPPQDSAAAFFGVPAGDCPGGESTKLPSSAHQTTLNVPVDARGLYSGPDALSPMNDNNQIQLSYSTLSQGDTYCHQPPQQKVTVGGTVMFSSGGQCQLPPTKADGSSCCVLYTWQPNEAGFYYTDCSMKMNIGGDGIYYFDTEVAGNEDDAGWGPDPEPHIHYDLICSGCSGGDTQYANKFYTNTIWDAQGAGPQHGAEQTTFNGQTTFKYNIILG